MSSPHSPRPDGEASTSRMLIGGSRSNLDIASVVAASMTIMRAHDIPSRGLSHPDARGSHTKIVLADDHVLTGSHNWSGGAFGTSQTQDSVLVESTDLAAVAADEFMFQWRRGKTSMTWYEFSWADFVTDGLLDDMISASASQMATAELRANVGDQLALLFEHSGGLPVTETEYGESYRTRLAKGFIGEAVAGLLGPSRQRTLEGLDLTDSDQGGPPTAIAVDRIRINLATADDLDALSDVGSTLAARIVEQRRVGGPFRGGSDLATRVDGISEAIAYGFSRRVTYALPEPDLRVEVTGDAMTDLATLADSMPGSTAATRLVQAVEGLVQYCAAVAHPCRQRPRLATLAAAGPAATTDVDAVTVLNGSSYYHRLQEMLEAASTRIDVCMFHIALPAENHPTRALLDKLTDASARGVDVRVLTDRDRPTDPYRSTIINAAALAHLKAGGAAVRVDAADRLLHSKFVCIDDATTIIGSHNWSAGSYFVFDDTSLVLHGTTATTQQRARFDEMWAQGESPPS